MSLAVQWNGTAMDITPVLTNNESTMAACSDCAFTMTDMECNGMSVIPEHRTKGGGHGTDGTGVDAHFLSA